MLLICLLGEGICRSLQGEVFDAKRGGGVSGGCQDEFEVRGLAVLEGGVSGELGSSRCFVGLARRLSIQNCTIDGSRGDGDGRRRVPLSVT